MRTSSPRSWPSNSEPGAGRCRRAAGWISVFALVTAGLAPASAGTITGIVTARGPTAPPAAGGGDAYGSVRYKFAERIDYDHLRDFVVYVDDDFRGAGQVPGGRPAVVVQRNVSFEPHVLPILVGTKVTWTNRDQIYHNVFSISEIKAFDLGLHTDKDEPAEVLFDTPGRVDVFCSIHVAMHCIILVLPSPYYAKVDARGRYTLTGVPAGPYHLKAWHDRLPPQSSTVVVPAEGSIERDFVLGFASLPTH
jgi:plastocyanin